MSKTPLESVVEMTQKWIALTPVILLGSGASVPYAIPEMGELRDFILNRTNLEGLDKTFLDQWKEFKQTLNSKDLESALNQHRLAPELTQRALEATWDCLTPADLKVFDTVIRNMDHLALSQLFAHLFDSTHSSISVVTSNYDRLAEYAADACGVPHFTGFSYGHVRTTSRPLRVYQGLRPLRAVDIWKVHGSLDWFWNSRNDPIGLPLALQRPSDFKPLIVTPGVDKFRQTHEEPLRSILAGADRALEEARSYLCIGYGFNDSHLQSKLVQRCDRDRVPIMILTKRLTAAASEFLQCRCKSYAAFEESDSGTRILTSLVAGPIEAENESLWRLEKFIARMI